MTVNRTPARCRRVAREEGLAPALTTLCDEALPGMVPCGPGGHAVVPAEVAATADRVWQKGLVFDRAAGEEEILPLRDGSLVALRHRPGGHTQVVDRPGVWEFGLAWLRLGVSEGLRDACVRYLDGRACGETTVLGQQLVKGAVADVLIEQLEVHAVLTGVDAPDLDSARLAHLQDQITVADRVLLRLLGAGGFLADGPGEVAYRSELLAEAYTPTEVVR